MTKVYVVLQFLCDGGSDCSCDGTVDKIFFSKDEAEKYAEAHYGLRVYGPCEIADSK